MEALLAAKSAAASPFRAPPWPTAKRHAKRCGRFAPRSLPDRRDLPLIEGEIAFARFRCTA